MKFLAALLTTLLLPLVGAYGAVYQESKAFLEEVFDGAVPKPRFLWMKKPLREEAEQILRHKPGFLRTRYWKNENQSVWILEEIGKTQPITFGIVIKDNQIKQIKVLAFRESRGWEIKHNFFTHQFIHASIKEDLSLDPPIDGISGATLSVRASTKVARLALLFDRTTH